MKKFSSYIFALYLACQPSLTFATFDSPAALQQGIVRDGTPRSFSGEMHAIIDDKKGGKVYIGSWLSGEMVGVGVRNNSFSMKLTLDVAAPTANVKLRTKFAVRKVGQSFYVQLQNIDASFEDDLNKLGFAFLMKKWIEIPFTEDYLAMIENSENDTSVLNNVLELEQTKTKSGRSYTLRFKEGFLEAFGQSMGSAATNFSIKIDTNAVDQFLFGKLALSANNATDDIVVTGKAQKINKAVVISAPLQSIKLDALMTKYPSALDVLPLVPFQGLSTFVPDSIDDETTLDTFNEEHPYDEDSEFNPPYEEDQTQGVSNRPSRRLIIQQQEAENAARTERMKESTSSSSSSAPSSSPQAEEQLNTSSAVQPGNGLSIGDRAAPVTIVEMGDYECPFCASFHMSTLSEIKRDYIATGKVRFVFRNFPLSFHTYAMYAANVVECARDQGDGYARILQENIAHTVENGDEPTKFYLDTLVQGTPGLDADALFRCTEEGNKQSVIDQDIVDANAAGITGVPAFWILGPNGTYEMISGAQPYDVFKTAIDRMLAK